MQLMKNKIRSERGASITFALLLFLVCAVIGSAVLVAGSAAAGRLSKIAENDQRYYSVNSAARLLIDLVEADEVKVTKEVKEKEDGSSEHTYRYALNGGEGSIVDEATTFSSLALEAAYQLSEKIGEEPSSSVEVTHTLTVSSGASGDDPLATVVTETIYPDGRLEFVVSKTDVKDTNSIYRIRLEFQNTGSDSGTERSFKWVLNDIESIKTDPKETNGGGTP